MGQNWPGCSLRAHAHTCPTPATASPRILFHESAFMASSFKNNSYHIPRASDIKVKGLRTDLQKKHSRVGGLPQEDRIRRPMVSSLTRVKQAHMFLLPAHLHLSLFLQHGVRSYLEGILLGKVQNHVPPLPSCIGGIKHLGREPTTYMCVEREMESTTVDPRWGCAALQGRRPRREEVGKAYRNLPTLLSEIHLNVFQCHHSTLSARRAEEISKRNAARPRSVTARDTSSGLL